MRESALLADEAIEKQVVPSSLYSKFSHSALIVSIIRLSSHDLEPCDTRPDSNELSTSGVF